MDKEKLKKEIASNAYNVGFGAKRHFASYDILTKIPNVISFLVLTIGIIQITYPNFPFQKEVSVSLIIISIATFYLNFSNDEIDSYKNAGESLTQMFNKLRQLYLKVDANNSNSFESEEKSLEEILNNYYTTSISKQIFLSQWYAHFKFFYELQIDWIDKELDFKFWKDKIPNSLKISMFTLTIIILLSVSFKYILALYEYISNV